MKSRVSLPKILFACAAGCLLSACGGDDNNTDPQPNPSPTANQYVGRWASECVTLGSVPGGPEQVDHFELRMRASSTTLPQNISMTRSSIGGPYTAQVTVEAITRNGSRYVPANGGEDFFACNVIQGIESVRLYFHDGDPDHYHEEDAGQVDANGKPITIKVENAYRAIFGDANAGAFTFYVAAENRAGTAVVRCSARDSQTGKQATTEQIFTVGGNSALSGLYAAAVKQIKQGQAAARSMRYEMELAQHGNGKNLLAREERIELFADANCKQSMLSDEGKTGAVLTWQYEQPVTLNGRQVQADTYLVGGNYQRWLYKEGETLWGRAAELDALGLNFVAFHRK